MKKIHTILLSIFVIITVTYLYCFTGTKNLPHSKVQEKYDPYFNMLVMPLIKYEKGFFKHTFYAQTNIKGDVYDLRFKINYLNHTVTVIDVTKLNERIKEINNKIARPVVHEYEYLRINEESYFDDIDSLTINLRLNEKVKGEDRQIIISVSDQDLKFTL